MLKKKNLKSNIYKMALIGKMLPNGYKFQEYSKFQKIKLENFSNKEVDLKTDKNYY